MASFQDEPSRMEDEDTKESLVGELQKWEESSAEEKLVDQKQEDLNRIIKKCRAFDLKRAKSARCHPYSCCCIKE